MPEFDDDLGAFSIPEFCDRYRICRSKAYQEMRADRLKTAKIGARTIVTRRQARNYQELIEAEAAAERQAREARAS